MCRSALVKVIIWDKKKQIKFTSNAKISELCSSTWQDSGSCVATNQGWGKHFETRPNPITKKCGEIIQKHKSHLALGEIKGMCE